MKRFLGFILLALTVASCDPKALSSDSRDALEGSWTCKEQAGLAYQVTISKAPLEEDKIWMDNLYKLNSKVDVTLAGSALSIPSQIISDYTLQGSGSVSSDKRKITLSFRADGTPVEATMTKN